MDFKLSKEQEAIRTAARQFAKGEFDKEDSLEHEKNHSYPKKMRENACKLGFTGLNFPQEYGGEAYGVLEKVLVVQEMCRQNSSFGLALSFADLGGAIIAKFGTKDQKEKYLASIISGKTLASVAYLEDNCQEDFNVVLGTRALKKDGGYFISGRKCNVYNSSNANISLVLCQTAGEAQPPGRGQSIILVDSEAEGFICEKGKATMGCALVPMSDQIFKDVFVPAENLIGAENNGQEILHEFLTQMKLVSAAQALGISEGAYEAALRHAKERVQFNRAIISLEAVQSILVDMVCRIEVGKSILYRAAQAYDDNDRDAAKLATISKIFNSEAAVQITQDAVQIGGGSGYMKEYPMEQKMRDAPFTEFSFGPNRVQRALLSNTLK